MHLRCRRLGWGLGLALLVTGNAAAEVRLEVRGAGDELEQNIRAHVGSLPEDAAATGRAYQRRVREATAEALQALGYYNATVDVSRRRDGEDATVTVQVQPGPRVKIASLKVELRGEARDDRVFRQIVEQLPLEEGEAFHHGHYESSKQALQTLALRRGYFDAEFLTSRVEVDAVDQTARVELVFDSGTRYSIGAVRFSDAPLEEQLLRRLVPFSAGDPYEAGEIAQLNRNLLESRYFEDVRVRPVPEEAADHRIPVEVELTAREPNQVAVGLGYSTDVGPRAQLQWTRPWVNRRGHSAGADLEVSEVRQSLATEYRIPLRDPLNDALELQFGVQHEDIEDTESELYTASVQREQKFSTRWRRTAFVRWEHEDYTVGDLSGKSNLVLPGLSFARTRVRSAGVDPTWGDRQLITVEATDPALLSDVRLVRVILGTRWLRSLGERHRVFLRGDAGAIATPEFGEIPPSLRFFAGGDQSIRGFGYREISPINADGERVGGRYTLVGSVEYSYEFRQNWRLATFLDAGNAMDALQEPYKIGSGFGVHWISPVGALRLDFAWGWTPNQSCEAVSDAVCQELREEWDDEPNFRIHFSLGPRL